MRMSILAGKVEELTDTLKETEKKVDDSDLKRKLSKYRRLFQKKLNYHEGNIGKGKEFN